MAAPLARMGLSIQPQSLAEAVAGPSTRAGLAGVIVWTAEPQGAPSGAAGWLAQLRDGCGAPVPRLLVGLPGDADSGPVHRLAHVQRGDRPVLYTGVPAPEVAAPLADLPDALRLPPGVYPALTAGEDAEPALTLRGADGQATVLAVSAEGALFLDRSVADAMPVLPDALFAAFRPQGPVPVPDPALRQGRRVAAVVVETTGWSDRAASTAGGTVGLPAHAILADTVLSHPARLPLTLAHVQGTINGTLSGPDARAARTAFEVATTRPGVRTLPAEAEDGGPLTLLDEGQFVRLARMTDANAALALAPVEPTDSTDDTTVVLPALSGPGGWADPSGLHGLRGMLDATGAVRAQLPAVVVLRTLDLMSFSGRRAAMSALDRLGGDAFSPVPVAALATALAESGQVRLVPDGPSAWWIEGRGAVDSLRVDAAADLAVDFAASTGVLGARRIGSALAVTLDPAVARPRVALTESAGRAMARDPVVPVLRHAGPALSDARWDGCSVTLRVTDSGPGTAEWSLAPDTAVTVRIGPDETVLRSDDSGHLLVQLPATYDTQLVLSLRPEAC